MPQNLKNHEIHTTVVQHQGSTHTSWKSPGSIFIDFRVDFGGPGLIFESLGASVSKVIFERIFWGRPGAETEKIEGDLAEPGRR